MILIIVVVVVVVVAAGVTATAAVVVVEVVSNQMSSLFAHMMYCVKFQWNVSSSDENCILCYKTFRNIYLHTSNTIVFSTLSAINWAQFYLSSTTIDRVSSFGDVIYFSTDAHCHKNRTNKKGALNSMKCCHNLRIAMMDCWRIIAHILVFSITDCYPQVWVFIVLQVTPSF